MISLSPLSGFKQITEFVFTQTPESSSHFVNWGDGSFSYENTSTHTYSAMGLYDVLAGDCSETSSFQVSVYNGEFFTDKILVTSESISSLVATDITYSIALSSSSQNSTISFYASGSDSVPYKFERNFWSHLVPEWKFSSAGKPVSSLEITGSPVYSGTNVLGYTALSTVSFQDDMPGNPVLFFNVLKKENDVPINSRVYSAFTQSVCAAIPDIVYITSDGINPISPIQWADKDIPYVLSVGSTQVTGTNILHYLSGSVVSLNFVADCYGNSLSAAQYVLGDIDYFDQQCHQSGGYILSSFMLPSSALENPSVVSNYELCDFIPENSEFYRQQKTPRNVSLSAYASVSYNSSSFLVSGTSNPFDIVEFSNRHDFYRKGEDKTIYDILNNSLPFDLNNYPNFNSYLSAVAGQGNTLGKAYDKISNFHTDHNDIDICHYEFLKDKADMADDVVDDFGLDFPEELKRVFNFTTLPLQKLVGTRCMCNRNFNGDTGVCKICGQKKRNNLGDLLTFDSYITAGDTILYKEDGDINFNFLTVPEQDTSVYRIRSLSAEPFASKGLDKFCFYVWDKTTHGGPIESVIDYKNVNNNLNPNLSSFNDWYEDGGIVEEMFSYILTKNLT